jgi:hypothetical protein
LNQPPSEGVEQLEDSMPEMIKRVTFCRLPFTVKAAIKAEAIRHIIIVLVAGFADTHAWVGSCNKDCFAHLFTSTQQHCKRGTESTQPSEANAGTWHVQRSQKK